MPLVSLLLACSPRDIALDPARPVVHSTDTAPVEDAGGDTADTDTTQPDVETWPKACSEIYDPDVLQTFELTFAPDQWAAVASDCSAGAETYRPVDLTWNGETVSAMARLKGNWSWDCNKLQFIISFDEVDPAGRFHGLRKIMLDAPWYDRTLLHERVAFPAFAQRDLPYSCVNHARLVINGEYYGLYANLERIDQEYLERHFEDPEGNLYQGGAELKTNETENDTSDLDALNAATTIDELATVIDLDQAVSEWATEAMLPAMDNYWAGVEINYYLYDNPGHGFTYLPYDLDISFGDGAYTTGELIWPDAATSDPLTYQHPGWLKEDIFKRVLADPAWCDRFVEELAAARAAYSPEDMQAQVATWDDQIADSLAEDPHKPYTTASHAAAVRDMDTFFETRAAYVDAWLAQGNHCPARW